MRKILQPISRQFFEKTSTVTRAYYNLDENIDVLRKDGKWKTVSINGNDFYSYPLLHTIIVLNQSNILCLICQQYVGCMCAS